MRGRNANAVNLSCGWAGVPLIQLFFSSRLGKCEQMFLNMRSLCHSTKGVIEKKYETLQVAWQQFIDHAMALEGKRAFHHERALRVQHNCACASTH